MENLAAEEDANTRLADDLSKIRVVEPREASLQETLHEKERTIQNRCHTSRECGVSDMILSVSSEQSIPQPNGIQHVSRITFVHRYIFIAKPNHQLTIFEGSYNHECLPYVGRAQSCCWSMLPCIAYICSMNISFVCLLANCHVTLNQVLGALFQLCGW